jgi:hypothetical protein
MKLAQLCNPLKQVVNTASLDESWALCRDTLLKLTSHGPVAQRCLESLEAIQEKISCLESSNYSIYLMVRLVNICPQKSRIPKTICHIEATHNQANLDFWVLFKKDSARIILKKHKILTDRLRSTRKFLSIVLTLDGRWIMRCR